MKGLNLRALIRDMDRFVIADGPPKQVPQLYMPDLHSQI
jgi:hypothetical protein